jgi:hypothetical protein
MLSGMADAESALCRLRAAQEGGISVPRDRDDGFRSSSRARLLREQD